MTTQGNEQLNYNNHPFSGRAGRFSFALAHNGVIHNDRLLRVTEQLPMTKIETDSYIAVQLLELQGNVDFASLSAMAEMLEGTFTFTVLDEGNNLYFVRGNNPMCIVHFPQEGFYLYASTEAIVLLSLNKLGLGTKDFDVIPIKQGELLRIDAKGQLARSSFDDSKIRHNHHLFWGWEDYCFPGAEKQEEQREYLEELKEAAEYFGVDSDAVEVLWKEGFSFMEIEEMLYEPDLLAECVAEVNAFSGATRMLWP